MHWATLIFSAKESLYKAWYPLTNRWLDFNEAELEIDPRECSFTAQVSAHLLKDSGLETVSFAGRFTIKGEYVFTAVVVAATT
jgi:4'-phosphopantetheinyl transferase EntD